MAQAELLPEVTKFLETGPKMIIGGKPVDSKSGKTFDVIDPAIGQGRVSGSRAEMFRTWMPRWPPHARRTRTSAGPGSDRGSGQRSSSSSASSSSGTGRSWRRSSRSTRASRSRWRPARCGPRVNASATTRAGRRRSSVRRTRPTRTRSSTRCASRWACAERSSRGTSRW